MHHPGRVAGLGHPLLGAGLEDPGQQKLVAHRVVVEEGVLVCHFEDLFGLGVAESLDVDGPVLSLTKLVLSCRACGSHGGIFFVVLAAGGGRRSALCREYSEVVDPVLLSPVDEIEPHLLGVLEVEFPGPEEAEEVGVVPLGAQFPSVPLPDHPPKGLQCGQVLGGAVAGEAG